MRRLLPQICRGVARRRFSNYTSSLNKVAHGPIATSIDPEEARHFGDLASSWWDVNGSQRILHLMNLTRLDFIQRSIKNSIKITNKDIIIPGYEYKNFYPSYVSNSISTELDHEIESQIVTTHPKTVLDIGCGGGILSESMARLPFVKSVLGIDLTPECISVAKEHAAKDPLLANKLSYDCKALDDLEDQYDLVMCLEMLEHVDIPSEILANAWQRLKPGGTLFISTINRDLVSWFTTIFVAESVLNVVPKGTHHLHKYINFEEIIQWFRDNTPMEYEIQDVKGMMYIPLRGWVEQDCATVGNYIMAIKKKNLSSD